MDSQMTLRGNGSSDSTKLSIVQSCFSFNFSSIWAPGSPHSITPSQVGVESVAVGGGLGSQGRGFSDGDPSLAQETTLMYLFPDVQITVHTLSGCGNAQKISITG